MEGDRQKVLFIGGMGRSGSTIIEKLLNEFPETHAVGETIHLWERGIRDGERCGCGEPFRDCPHWSAVGHEAFSGWDNVDLDRIIDLRWRIDRSRQLPSILRSIKRGRPNHDQSEYLDFLNRVLLASARVTNNRAVLLESSKHLSTGALLSLDSDLDVRVLHLVRDPRGVAYSWTKDVARPEASTSDQAAMMPTYRPSRTAGRWVSDNLGFALLARIGVPTLTLRYEDVLRRPAESLRALAYLMDIGPDPSDPSAEPYPLPFLDGSRAHLEQSMHSIAGNPVRFGGDDVELRLDDAWRTKFRRRDQQLVAAITAPLLAWYGYRLKS